jgi:hypothetical protein
VTDVAKHEEKDPRGKPETDGQLTPGKPPPAPPKPGKHGKK